MDTNLLEETMARLDRHSLTTHDVLWVGSADGKIVWTWDQFAAGVADIEYDKGFGYQEIAADLVVVGLDWWLERYEYDGSEGWEFKRRPRLARPHDMVLDLPVSVLGYNVAAAVHNTRCEEEE